ncbi:hypothetical protein NB688_003882 [Xanthomonas sacchari]|uniref:Uncharacterized protein n=1 Tax=Xanthomonas sacchari TaxID=56458 RepID=A0ABT3DX43_9XANT|nr:hypothetical protein [Xanthomonas sacchari]MCW0421716.1 hypothetical protein [Xanthomonas sacchari]
MAASSRRICAGCCGRIATEGPIHERWETLRRNSFRRDARARQSASRRKPLLKDRLHPTDRLGRERVRRSARRRCGGCARTAAEHRTSWRDRRLRRGCARAANRARMLRCGTTWRKQGCERGGMSRRLGAPMRSHRGVLAQRCGSRTPCSARQAPSPPAYRESGATSGASEAVRSVRHYAGMSGRRDRAAYTGRIASTPVDGRRGRNLSENFSTHKLHDGCVGNTPTGLSACPRRGCVRRGDGRRSGRQPHCPRRPALRTLPHQALRA